MTKRKKIAFVQKTESNNPNILQFKSKYFVFLINIEPSPNIILLLICISMSKNKDLKISLESMQPINISQQRT